MGKIKILVGDSRTGKSYTAKLIMNKYFGDKKCLCIDGDKYNQINGLNKIFEKIILNKDIYFDFLFVDDIHDIYFVSKLFSIFSEKRGITCIGTLYVSSDVDFISLKKEYGILSEDEKQELSILAENIYNDL
jgi:ABC-type dipeptide/oligopeptide/nickel transport system ATPase component